MKKTTLTAIALALGIAADVNASIQPDRYNDPCFIQTPLGPVPFCMPMDEQSMPEGEWVQEYFNMGRCLQRVFIFIPYEEATYPEEDASEEESYDQRPAKRRNRRQRKDREEYSSRRSEKTPKAEETYGSERERTPYRDEAPVAEAPAIRSTSMSMYDPSAIQWGTNDSLGDPNDFKTRVMRGKKYWNVSGFELNEQCMRFINYVICDESSSVEVLDLCNSGVNDDMAYILFNGLRERQNPLRVLLQENKLTPEFLQQTIDYLAGSQIQIEH